uniref:Uncharacterized protein n=1 Tax=Kalanchoe fedtschenkoi TaxID=63787 RepID=A0A7N0TRA5_KALFE
MKNWRAVCTLHCSSESTSGEMGAGDEVDYGTSDEEVMEEKGGGLKAKEHVKQLQRLQEKDPEFYEFLKEHDKELLEFGDEDDIDDDEGTEVDEEGPDVDCAESGEETEDPNLHEVEDKQSRKVITSAMVDSWCEAVRENVKVGAVSSLLKTYRSACHYGDDSGSDASSKFNVMSSNVFNKIEANSKFTNARRASISFLPNDPAASSFPEDEKTGGARPLSQYVKDLQERSRQRNEALVESSAVVGEHASVFGGRLPESDEEDDGRDEEGAAVFSSDWLPGSDSKSQKNAAQGPKKAKKKKKQKKEEETVDEYVVEDLVISSD